MNKAMHGKAGRQNNYYDGKKKKKKKGKKKKKRTKNVIGRKIQPCATSAQLHLDHVKKL